MELFSASILAYNQKERLAMNEATLAQGTKLLTLILGKKVSVQTMQYLFDTVIFADILSINKERLEAVYSWNSSLREKIQSVLQLHNRIEILPERYILNVDRGPDTSLKELLNGHQVKYDPPAQIREPWNYENYETPERTYTHAAEFRLAKVSSVRGNQLSPREVRRALFAEGWIAGDQFELAAFVPYFRESKLPFPVLGLGGSLHQVEGLQFSDAVYYYFPSLKFSGRNRWVRFNHEGWRWSERFVTTADREDLYLVYHE